MTSEEAAKVKLYFGMHRGKTLEEIPLSYVRWLSKQAWVEPHLARAVKAYMKSDWFQTELEVEQVERREDNKRRRARWK